MLDYDNSEKRIKFASANISKIGPVVQASFPQESSVNLEKNGCQPVFAMLRYKACVFVIAGVDGPLILQQIGLNIPDNKTSSE
jgi:hypothetical protein